MQPLQKPLLWKISKMYKRAEIIIMAPPIEPSLGFNTDQFRTTLFHLQLPNLARLFESVPKGGFSVCFHWSSWGFRRQMKGSLSRGCPGGDLLRSQPKAVGSPQALCSVHVVGKPMILQERTNPTHCRGFPGLLLSLCIPPAAYHSSLE